jgi:hypothetical protein
MKPYFTFEAWKAYLREDCQRTHKLLISDGENVLELLWSRGIEPTVQAIIDDADSKSRWPPPTDA